jgi:ubiquinone/menaquinone biosynthesis C-methylase UbiE
MWQDWIMVILPFVNRWPVLEIGHGPGHLQVALKQRDARTFGVDASRQMSKLARMQLRKEGYRLSLVTGNAQTLPYPNNTFRCVVSTFPAEFIFDPKTVSEIWRVLIPGGDFYILPGAWITGKRWIERFAAWIFRFTKQSPDFPESSEGGRNLADQTSPWLSPFQRIGFGLEINTLNLKSSRLMVLHGVKKLADN